MVTTRGTGETLTSPTMGELYVRAMARTSAILDAVRADQWRGPTPCTEWDVKQVANHIIGENLWASELYQGKTIAEVGSTLDGDLAGEDPATAYRASVAAASTAVTAPGGMEAVCHLSFGDYSGSDYAAQLFLDTVIHGWDLAKATGQDTTLDPELVEACFTVIEPQKEMLLGSGAFGTDHEAEPGADRQTAMLELLGRTP